MSFAWIAFWCFVLGLIVGAVIGWCLRGMLTNVVTYENDDTDSIGGN